jgi:hypothetical protein
MGRCLQMCGSPLRAQAASRGTVISRSLARTAAHHAMTLYMRARALRPRCRSCGCVRLSWVCSRRGSMVCRPELTTQLLKRISAAAHIGIECVHRIHEDPLPNQARAATVAAASLDRPVGEHRLPVFAAHDQAVDGRQKKRSASVTLPSSPLPSEVQRDLDGTLDQPRQRFAHKKRSALSQNRS